MFNNIPKIQDADIKRYVTETKPAEFDVQDPQDHKIIRLWKMRRQWNKWPRSLVGFILAIILVYFVGRLLASYFGRKLWQLFEGTVQQVPGFKQVYPYVKQVTDYLFGEKKLKFSRVVAVPYPRHGLYSLGFVTGQGWRSIREATGQDMVQVFIPSSPTPVTGYVAFVRREEIIELPITVDQALRFSISGGVIVPPKEIIEAATVAGEQKELAEPEQPAWAEGE